MNIKRENENSFRKRRKTNGRLADFLLAAFAQQCTKLFSDSIHFGYTNGFYFPKFLSWQQ